MSYNNLPSEWIITKFTDLLDIQGGTQPPKSEFIDKIKKDYIRLLQIRDFGNKPVPTFVPLTSKLKLCNKNDILIGRYGASLGRICTGMSGAYNVALTKVIFGKYINRKYLKVYLESELFQESLRLLSRSAQNGFNKDDLKSFNFILPPLFEQKIITNKLDLLLAHVEKTKSRLEKIPEILKQFRQSVLSDAVNGRLTKNFIHHTIFNKSLLGQVLNLVYGKALPAKERSGTGYPVYGSNGEIGKHGQKLVKGPFIIVGRKGSYGEITWSEDSGWPIDTTYYVTLKKNIDLKFIYYLLQTLGLTSLNRSTAIPGLNREDAYKLEIDLPSLEEQHEIVRRVEQLFAYADKIEKQVNAALEKVNNLTQSILAKAFRGELTALWREQHPELITGENSAKALLEKIQQEKSMLVKKRKSK
ncbi:restriction endonuclease subunit S [Gilliamella apicola]|uniref:restriction endonuclease subunit S n=1 Tax=Gilliamella apicola TaxID=1196095 RepID=UPI002FEE11FC